MSPHLPSVAVFVVSVTFATSLRQHSAIRMLRQAGCHVHVDNVDCREEVAVVFGESNYHLDLVLLLPKIVTLRDLCLQKLPNLKEAAPTIRTLRALRLMMIHECPLSLDVYDKLDALPNLTTLWISNCGLDQHGINWIARFTALRSLTIRNENLRACNLQGLKDLPLLSCLRLENCCLDDHLVRQMAGNANVLYLSLRGNAIGDEGLAATAKMQGLLILQLDSTRVTDQGLENFLARHPPNLTSISVSDGCVSASGITNLRKRYPNILLRCETRPFNK